MKKVINFNVAHLNYLTPLIKWRVMNLENLRKENCFNHTYKNFHRIISSLEKNNVLEGYRDPYTRKKFIYLSSFGERQILVTENPMSLSRETLIHDIKVSEITKELLDQGHVDEVELEHQVHNKKNFLVTYKIIPDAVLHFKKNDANYRIAFELELSRKNNQRISEKIRQYEASDYYHYVIYLFPNINLLKKYHELIKSIIKPQSEQRFFLMCHDALSLHPTNLDNINGYQGIKEVKLLNIFNRSN